jgi:CubicO group peptidase (beta-lactamase class C family)
VIKDDKPIFLRAYGMADKEAGIKADTDTLYYIASSTKSFTALAAAMLDQEGKIKFSDPVTKYTPGIRFKNDIPDKITIRDLLTHTSGCGTGRSSTASPLRARSTRVRSITSLPKAPLLMMPTLASTTIQTSATTFTGSRCITI